MKIKTLLLLLGLVTGFCIDSVAGAAVTCTPPTVTASGPTMVCAGTGVTLTSSAPSGNIWSTGSTAQSITVYGSGSYSVKAVVGSCTSAASNAVTVTVNPNAGKPTVTASGPLTFCSGGSVTLTSSAATGNLWSNGATTQSISVTSTGSYSVKIVTGGCTSVASSAVLVTVNSTPATPVATAQGTTAICPGGIVVLHSSAINGNRWSTGDTTQNITVSTAGNYWVKRVTMSCTSEPSAPVVVTVAPPTTPIISAGVPTNGLVAWYPFNGNANDASGNGRNGSLNGGVSLATDRHGNANGAYSFSGNGTQYITASIGTALPTTSRTVSFWFNSPVANTRLFPFSYGGDGSCGSSYFVALNNERASNFEVQQHCWVNLYFAPYTNNLNNTWNQLTVVHDNAHNLVHFYLNGLLIQSVSGSNTTAVNANTMLTIGRVGYHNGDPYYNSGTSSSWFTGSLDDVMLYNRPLSSTEVQALYLNNNTTTAGASLCIGGSVTLTSSAVSGNLWSNGATTQSISVSTPGTYSVKVQTGTCTSAVSSPVTVTVNPVAPVIPTISVSGSATICNGNSVTLTSSAATGNIWSTGSNAQSITVYAAGNYSVKSVSGACTSASSTSVTVSVNGANPAKPTVSASGPLTFCAGGSVILTSSAASGNHWSNGATTQSITVSATSSHTVSVVSGACTSTASAATVVVVNPIPTTPVVTPQGPTTFCTGKNVVLRSAAYEGNLWSTGETTQNITVSRAGTYSVKRLASGCTSAVSNVVTVVVMPPCREAADEPEPRIEQLSLYPNPSTGAVTLQSPTGSTDIDVINTLGQVVHSAAVTSVQTELDLSSLPKGMYMAQVKGTGKNQTIRFILR